MAIDLETGEVGDAWELFVKAVKRRHERWAEYSEAGLAPMETWGNSTTPDAAYRPRK